ncbi:MAG: hypothetical protein HGN29_01015 [Asgard group archaeon]|nr:hypothetical protein [Asgard group archaeon]
MSKKDEFKSLVGSINMVKNMVESIVSAVQDRFKDYDNVVVSLKERLDILEAQAGQSTSTQAVPADATGLVNKIEQLTKRMDSLNERILLIEATKSVQDETVVEPTDVQAIKDIAAEAPSVAPEPVPAIEEAEAVAEFEIPTEAPEKEITSIPVPPIPESIPVPSAEIPSAPPTQKIEEVELPKVAPTVTPTEVPAPPPPAPKPATQVTEAVERDVSPISKQVSGSIPMPPKKEVTTDAAEIQPSVLKTEEEPTVPEEGKSAEIFGEAVSGDKAELLKALKKLEDL